MLNNIRKKSQGFTIIEVMIVLAIAGLILLIVFLAVPALQRNSRNTSRKDDIGRIAAVVNDYVANNNGQMPTDDAAGDMLFVDQIDKAGNLGQFSAPDAKSIETGAQSSIPVTSGKLFFRLVVGAKCGGAFGATQAATSRQGAIQYQLETNKPAAPNNVCQDI